MKDNRCDSFRPLSRWLGCLTRSQLVWLSCYRWVSVPFRGNWGVLPKVKSMQMTNSFSLRPLQRWLGCLTNLELINEKANACFRPLARWHWGFLRCAEIKWRVFQTLVSVPSRGEWGAYWNHIGKHLYNVAFPSPFEVTGGSFIAWN